MTHQTITCNSCGNELARNFDGRMDNWNGIRVFTRNSSNAVVDDISLEVNLRVKEGTTDTRLMIEPFRLGWYCNPECFVDHLTLLSMTVDLLYMAD